MSEPQVGAKEVVSVLRDVLGDAFGKDAGTIGAIMAECLARRILERLGIVITRHDFGPEVVVVRGLTPPPKEGP